MAPKNSLKDLNYVGYIGPCMLGMETICNASCFEFGAHSSLLMSSMQFDEVPLQQLNIIIYEHLSVIQETLTF